MDTVKKPTPKERKQATTELKEYHSKTFELLQIQDPIFIPKMAHFVTDLEGLHMGFFESELNQGEDIYTEKVSKVMEPEDEARTLYKLRSNPHFKEEYATSDPMHNGHVRYFIPLDELETVEKVTPMPVKTDYGIIDPDEDPALSEMTMRDLTAILLKEPVSKRPWLNELIKNLK